MTECATCGQQYIIPGPAECWSCVVARFPEWWFRCIECDAELPATVPAVIVREDGLDQVLCTDCADEWGCYVGDEGVRARVFTLEEADAA